MRVQSFLHSLLLKNCAFICILSLLIPSISGQCYSSIDNLNSSCTICLSNGNYYNCSHFSYPNQSNAIDFYTCSYRCCSFDYKITMNFCNQPTSVTTSDNSKTATILIIIFFTVPAAVCLCIILISCFKRRSNMNQGISTNE